VTHRPISLPIFSLSTGLKAIREQAEEASATTRIDSGLADVQGMEPGADHRPG
jgi:hypothetical protein